MTDHLISTSGTGSSLDGYITIDYTNIHFIAMGKNWTKVTVVWSLLLTVLVSRSDSLDFGSEPFLDQLYQEQDDDGSGETTVEPVSTQPPSTEPPTPPPGVSAPDLDNVNHAIKLSLSLIGDYTEELSDPESQEYWDLKIDATTTLLNAFKVSSHLGFVDINILHFRNGSIIIDYDALYSVETLLQLENATLDVFTDIEEDIFEKLKTQQVDGLQVDGDYLDNLVNTTEYKDQKKSLTVSLSDPCASYDVCTYGESCMVLSDAQNPVCVQPCYSVSDDNDVIYMCDDSSQVCSLDVNSEDSHCSCKTNYLPVVGNDYACFHQDILIGLCCGFGLAIILILIILVVYLCRKKGKETEEQYIYGDNYYTGANTPVWSDTDTMCTMETIDARTLKSQYRGANYRSYAPSLGQGTATRAERGAPGDVSSEEIDTMVYDNKACVGDQEKPSEDTIERNPLMKQLAETEAYKNFQPQLDKVDHDLQYFSLRPVIKLNTSSNYTLGEYLYKTKL